jgi:hypothetical protein
LISEYSQATCASYLIKCFFCFKPAHTLISPPSLITSLLLSSFQYSQRRTFSLVPIDLSELSWKLPYASR